MLRSKKGLISVQTDEELIASIINGQVSAFDELYTRYHKRLLYYFYRMLGNNEQIAQDFMQDIFFKIIDKPHLFDHRKKFSTWIFSIAHNMCKNEYRRNEVRKIILKTDNPDVFCMDVNEKTNHEKIIVAIFDELDLFDENHKTAFLLKYREGFSIEEISDTLNLPAGTVKSRLFYTRKKLQEILTGKYTETIETLF
ncbi:MAG: RNA polymerase sigma factor [Bacteroidales bacterium]|nr:RNA polymerase sigma factor [Bacteroidales bacterium]